MKIRIILLLIVLPYVVFAQRYMSSVTVDRHTYEELINSPTYFDCDSINTYRVYPTFWRNKMPMTNHAVLHWSIRIGVDEMEPIEFGGNQYACPRIIPKKYYFFYKDEVVIFSLTELDKEEIVELYRKPEFIVVEYYEPSTNSISYLMNKGPFYVDEID